MDTDERVKRLKQARAASAAVKDEIIKQTDLDPRPSVMLKWSPVLRRAWAEVTDLDLMINDLDGVTEPVPLDESLLANLDRLSAQLDAAIARDALLQLGVDSAVRVLDAVKEVRETLA
jgi:hypothetical protein